MIRFLSRSHGVKPLVARNRAGSVSFHFVLADLTAEVGPVNRSGEVSLGGRYGKAAHAL